MAINNGSLCCMDACTAPRAIQEKAFRKGLIPYLPEEEQK
jgi:hypothetical protein